MGLQYAVPFENVSVSAAQDFWEISPADDKVIAIKAIILHPVGGTADAADADSENWRCSIVRGHTTSGSGGSSVTPLCLASSALTAAGFAAEANNTTIASTSGTTIFAFGCNVRNGTELWFPDGSEPRASQTNTTIVVRLLSTPADAVAMSGTLIVEEVL